MSGVDGSLMRAGGQEAPASVIRTLLKAGVAALSEYRSALARNKSRINELTDNEW